MSTERSPVEAPDAEPKSPPSKKSLGHKMPGLADLKSPADSIKATSSPKLINLINNEVALSSPSKAISTVTATTVTDAKFVMPGQDSKDPENAPPAALAMKRNTTELNANTSKRTALSDLDLSTKAKITAWYTPTRAKTLIFHRHCWIFSRR